MNFYRPENPGMNPLSEKTSTRNFGAFLWHAFFLALTTSFMDVDTIIPSMLIKAGGGSFSLGLLTAIMLGGSSLMQLVFAGFLSGKAFKKKFLLSGIYLRSFALACLAVMFFASENIAPQAVIILIFVFISIFSFSGAFANVSYVDILGKSVLPYKRKKFFTMQQTFNGIGLMISALIVRELLKYFDYPANYSILFVMAALLLSIASGGFWLIKEAPSQKKPGKSLIEFFRMIPGEIKNNPNLKLYLMLINILGLGISILPFFILLAKEKFGLTDASVGNFLVFRISGMLLISLIIFGFSRKRGYKKILAAGLIIGVILPPLALFLSDFQFMFQFVFILSGAFFSIYKISVSGILVEISNTENRAVYAGIAGAGNILPAIFPLIAGALIALLGYWVVFVFVSAILLLAIPVVKKLNCDSSPDPSD
jgi:MFS family permease